MTAQPPYLLIDVDGVLNPFPGPGGSVPPGFTPHRLDLEDATNVPVWLNPDHGTWIVATRSLGIVRPRWATSWGGEANRLVGPRIGLDPIPYVDLGTPDITSPHPKGYLWKRDTVSAWCGNTPLAWIDDDFAPSDHEWATRRATNGVPTLLLQPDPYQGLQRSHIDAVCTWAIAVTRDLNTDRDHHGTKRTAPPDTLTA